MKKPMPVPVPAPAAAPAGPGVQTGRGHVPVSSHNPANHISNMPTVGGGNTIQPMPAPPGQGD